MDNRKKFVDFSANKYMRDIRRIKDVGNVDQIELVRKAKGGNIEARNSLIEMNLKFVAQKARERVNVDVELSDLITCGVEGMIIAIKNFDDTKGVQFLTYAGPWIEAKMQEAISKERTHISREPSFSPMYDLEDCECSNNVPSDDYDSYINAESSIGVYETEYKLEHQRKFITEMMTCLTPRERDVITMYYGLNDTDECELPAIAKVLGVSSERARKIKESAVHKLRSKAVGKYAYSDI